MMATFLRGSAFAADYGDMSRLRIQPGYGTLDCAFRRAMLAQFDESDVSVCVDEDDVVMHCGYLECHHDGVLHEFDAR